MEEFVKQEPRNVIHTPYFSMLHILYHDTPSFPLLQIITMLHPKRLDMGAAPADL
jgi:hypothetical protein